ncbi:rubredoxin-NAD(+) reductase [Pseudoalteromonas undina]|nr:rubredoxin-NAD(+) reductase [Pseudoalteromonas undina]
MKKWLCIICGLIYDEAQGWPADGIPPGTLWEDVPQDWVCPDCLVGKADFEMIEISEDELTEGEVTEPAAVQHTRVSETIVDEPQGPIVIIGSGHSGYQVAAALRKQSSTVAITVFTADDGALYSKPALSNAFAMGKSAADLQNEAALEWEQRLNIRVYPHTRVERIDADNHSLITSIGRYKYGRLVLATGASAIKIPIAGDASEVLSVNDLHDYAQLRAKLDSKKRVAILGDGLIGCEFANDLSAKGYEVSVIGLGQWPMYRLIPQVVGEALQQKLAGLGVSWYLEDSINRIEVNDSVSLLHLNSGQVIEVDVVLSAVGLVPNVTLAEQAGLEVERGIKVNDDGQTSRPAIFALGDCAQTSQGWQPYIAPINQILPALVNSLLGNVTNAKFLPSPVIVKTPIMPLTIFPVPPMAQGQWHIKQQGEELVAVFNDANEQILGFALLGKQVQANRSYWLEQISLNNLAATE